MRVLRGPKRPGRTWESPLGWVTFPRGSAAGGRRYLGPSNRRAPPVTLAGAGRVPVRRPITGLLDQWVLIGGAAGPAAITCNRLRDRELIDSVGATLALFEDVDDGSEVAHRPEIRVGLASSTGIPGCLSPARECRDESGIDSSASAARVQVAAACATVVGLGSRAAGGASRANYGKSPGANLNLHFRLRPDVARLWVRGSGGASGSPMAWPTGRLGIVRFAPYPGPPSLEEAAWYRDWLTAQSDRRLIYAARASTRSRNTGRAAGHGLSATSRVLIWPGGSRTKEDRGGPLVRPVARQGETGRRFARVV